MAPSSDSYTLDDEEWPSGTKHEVRLALMECSERLGEEVLGSFPICLGSHREE